MASFGKIILFRTEDLIVGAPLAFQPIIAVEDQNLAPGIDLDLAETLKPIPFNTQTTLDNQTTAFQNYRILGNNYRVGSDNSFSSERYEEFYRAGNRRKNLLLDFQKNGETDIFEGPEGVITYEPLEFTVVKYPNPSDNPNFINLKNSIGQQYSIEGLLTFQRSNQPFINHNLVLSKPLTSNSIINGEDINLEQYGIGDSLKITSVYNYYLKDYEQLYNSLSQRVNFDINYAEEKSIPNFYYLLSLLASPKTFSTVVPIDAKIPFTIEGLLEGIVPPSNGELSKAPLGLILPRQIMQFEQGEMTERNSVVVVTPSFYKNMANEISTQKTAHPFYNEIAIPIQKGGTVFRDLFKNIKMFEQLQYRAALQIKIINKAISKGLNVEDITSNYDIFYTKVNNTESGLKVEYRDSKQPFPNQPDTGTPYTIPSAFLDRAPKLIEFDVDINEDGSNIDFKGTNGGVGGIINFENYVASNLKVLTPGGKVNGSGANFNLFKDNSVINQVGEVTSPLTFFANNPQSENEYISSVIQSQANSVLKFIFNKAKLNVFSVFDNKKNYSETLFFEVQKLNAETNSLIQTFILPNDPDIGDMVTYIDSQIKYGKEYIYKIYTHTLSIGNRMKREDLQEQKPGPLTQIEDNAFLDTQKATFMYQNRYDVKIVRAPYYNTEDFLMNGEEIRKTVNVDSPPVPPNIQFYPYKNVSDKIGFWFNIGLGEVKMIPEMSLNSDEQNTQLEKYIKSVKLKEAAYKSGDPVLYKTDDFGGKIEVYRITQKPKSYSEFKQNKIADIDVIGPRTLVDNIAPNQDYYYTFRHVDTHGLPSNPSPVYHLKMITSDSAMEPTSVRVGVEGLQPVLFNELIYLSKNTYEEQKVEKSFKKYLLVEPTLAQTYLSFDNFEKGDVSSDFDTANDVKLNQDSLVIGKGGEDFVSVKGKKFKIRVTSKQTGRKIDLNVDFKNLSVIENYKE